MARSVEAGMMVSRALVGLARPALLEHPILMRALVLLLLAGCGRDPATLIIDELEVTGVVDEFTSRVEIEVHLYEVSDGGRERHLGCAGEDTGLEDVDLSDVRATPRAHFQPRAGEKELTIDDVRESRVRFVVIEDDRNACPVEQDATFRAMPTIDNEDDLVGTSSIVESSELESGTQMSFGNVVRLAVGTLGD